MLREGIGLVLTWLRRAITQPLQELNRWQRAARYAYDLGRFGARQLREDRAPQMAAALAFRTLFGLAPVLVVGMILIKAIKGSDEILRSLHALFVAAGLDKIQVATAEPESALTLAAWLDDLIGQLATTNLAGIGWVGTAVVVYAAIGLMVTIENTFDVIYRASGGRSWSRRVTVYWFILTVGPVMFVLASYLHAHFNDWIASTDTWQWLLLTAQVLSSFAAVWLFMFAVYALVPNAAVKLGPACVGAVVATLLLGAGKHTLGAYLGGAFSINQLYGSLGLVPLFMFWVYLMWLAILFGLQVSSTLQMLSGKTLNQIDQPYLRSGIVDPTAVLTVMEVAAEQFLAGRPVTVDQLADTTAIPRPTAARIVERLVRQGWLHRVERPDQAVTLAKPPEQMNATEFIEIGFEMADEGSRGRASILVERLRAAQQTAAEGSTLAMLVARP